MRLPLRAAIEGVNEPGAKPRPVLPRVEVRRSRTAEVVGILLESIVRGELAPGSLHSAGDLATSLGVSRTPVREALIELTSRGMVRFERNRGVRILQTSLHDLEEVFELRLLLEVPASRRAVEQLTQQGLHQIRSEYTAMVHTASAGDEQGLWVHDRAFHHVVLLQSGNRRLADYVDGLRDLVLVRGATTAGRSRTLVEIAEEHRLILDRIEARDAEGTAEAMRAHLANTAELLIRQEQGAPER